MSIKHLPAFIRENYEVHEWKHACAVFKTDFSQEWKDVIDVLATFRLDREHIIVGGGGKSKVAQSLDTAFVERGWVEKKFYTKIQVDEQIMESPTHKVDCFKNCVALEIEWSNKDPFFDRDLNNFRLLFDLRAISVGIIVTKADELRSAFEKLGVADKYGLQQLGCRSCCPESKVEAEVVAQFLFLELKNRCSKRKYDRFRKSDLKYPR